MFMVVSPRRRRWGRWALLAYLAALAASHVVLRSAGEEPVPEPRQVSFVSPVHGDESRPGRGRFTYLEWGATDGTVVVLLHGSPGSRFDFRSVAPHLNRRFRLIAPDLPGFGDSGKTVRDYSIRSHAGYTLQLLDQLGIESAHLVGFSMGAG